MQDNRALQAGTSHNLGQNFSKQFDLKFQSEEGREEYAWNTSWGTSTRMVGGMVMTHGDDAGRGAPPAGPDPGGDRSHLEDRRGADRVLEKAHAVEPA
jgi:prolyl-tRNA synthetase